MRFEIHSEISVAGFFVWLIVDRMRVASSSAFSLINVRNSLTSWGLCLINSESVIRRPDRTSRDEQMTPPLLAELSLIIRTPLASSASLASVVRYRLAPSTIALEVGMPVGSRKSCQLF